MVDGGDEVIEDIKQSTDKIIKNIAKAMEVDPIKEKMLNNIQESLPLRDIVEGKEVMMVGDISMDKKTMEKLFGTSDFAGSYFFDKSVNLLSNGLTSANLILSVAENPWFATVTVMIPVTGL